MFENTAHNLHTWLVRWLWFLGRERRGLDRYEVVGLLLIIVYGIGFVLIG